MRDCKKLNFVYPFQSGSLHQKTSKHTYAYCKRKMMLQEEPDTIKYRLIVNIVFEGTGGVVCRVRTTA